jgi:hypothetical protein
MEPVPHVRAPYEETVRLDITTSSSNDFVHQQRAQATLTLPDEVKADIAWWLAFLASDWPSRHLAIGSEFLALPGFPTAG